MTPNPGAWIEIASHKAIGPQVERIIAGAELLLPHGLDTLIVSVDADNEQQQRDVFGPLLVWRDRLKTWPDIIPAFRAWTAFAPGVEPRDNWLSFAGIIHRLLVDTKLSSYLIDTETLFRGYYTGSTYYCLWQQYGLLEAFFNVISRFNTGYADRFCYWYPSVENVGETATRYRAITTLVWGAAGADITYIERTWRGPNAAATQGRHREWLNLCGINSWALLYAQTGRDAWTYTEIVKQLRMMADPQVNAKGIIYPGYENWPDACKAVAKAMAPKKRHRTIRAKA